MRGLVGPRGEHEFRAPRSAAAEGPAGARHRHIEVSWEARVGASAARRARGPLGLGHRAGCCGPGSCRRGSARGCVDRPELVAARFEQGLEGRLVAVVAGAGYGKTTLLAQALQSDRPHLWCGARATRASAIRARCSRTSRRASGSAVPGLRHAPAARRLRGGGRHRALQRGRRDGVGRLRARRSTTSTCCRRRRSTAWACWWTTCRPTRTWPSPAGLGPAVLAGAPAGPPGPRDRGGPPGVRPRRDRRARALPGRGAR